MFSQNCSGGRAAGVGPENCAPAFSVEDHWPFRCRDSIALGRRALQFKVWGCTGNVLQRLPVGKGPAEAEGERCSSASCSLQLFKRHEDWKRHNWTLPWESLCEVYYGLGSHAEPPFWVPWSQRDV